MKNEWEEKLRCFPQVWDRVCGAAKDAPKPSCPPPLMPGRKCCTRATRFNPHGRCL